MIALAVLWGCYGFRYDARPDGLAQNPALNVYLNQYSEVANAAPLRALARAHILPEAYIWGLANTKITEQKDISYLFGRLRRHGTWMYFPVAMAVKSTIPFLAMLALAVWIALRERSLRWRWAMLLIPVAVFLGIAMHSDMNIGVRHILPIYPFLYIVGASAVGLLAERDRRWLVAAAALLVFQIVTSVRSFPGYMAYANEAWGGQQRVHLLLSDSNSDWGQQLKTTAAYLRERGMKNCWIAYTASGVADESYYGVSCRPLPTMVNLWWIRVPMEVPREINGTVLISDDELEGIDLPFGAPNPYAQFKKLKPTAVLDGGMMVYDGRFDMTAASAAVEQAKKAASR